MESRSAWCGASCSCPGPAYGAQRDFNAGLPDRCTELATKPHYRKDTEERGLFSETVRRCPLPGSVSTWSRGGARGRPVRRGHARGRHRYSADRANAGRGVIVGLRALEVEVLDSSGKHLATASSGVRQGQHDSEDPSMQLALLCNKPASDPTAGVRDALPDPLREWLDRQDRQTRNEAPRPSNALTGIRVGERGRGDAPSSNRPAGRTAPVSLTRGEGSPRAWRVSNTTMTGRI